MTRFFRSLQSQHRAVLFAFLLLAAAGIALGLKLPAAILPEVTFPRITVIADSGERDTDEMLRGVTMPLEQSIRRVPGLPMVGRRYGQKRQSAGKQRQVNDGLPAWPQPS